MTHNINGFIDRADYEKNIDKLIDEAVRLYGSDSIVSGRRGNSLVTANNPVRSKNQKTRIFKDRADFDNNIDKMIDEAIRLYGSGDGC